MGILSIKTVAVFAGSSDGDDPVYAKEMYKLGFLLTRLGKEVWAGGCVGMGRALAEGVAAGGGRLIVFQPEYYCCDGREMPDFVDVRYLSGDDDRITQLLEADAFATGPGSAGTNGETGRGITRNLDGTYKKPPLPIKPHFVMNVAGCHDFLIESYREPVRRGFGAPETLQLFRVVPDADRLAEELGKLEGQELLYLSRVSSMKKVQPRVA